MRKPLTATEKATRQAALAAETKHDKFRRLANYRVNRAIACIALVGNLAGSQYEATTEDKEKVIVALSDAVVAVADRLNRVKSSKPAFTL